jgi:hypothetical protein
MDGNGRIAGFLMNVMLAAGGYPWLLFHLKNEMIILKRWKVGV